MGLALFYTFNKLVEIFERQVKVITVICQSESSWTPEKPGINAERSWKSGIFWKKLEIDTLSISPLLLMSMKEFSRKF